MVFTLKVGVRFTVEKAVITNYVKSTVVRDIRRLINQSNVKAAVLQFTLISYLG